jgi:16S rRNA (adenine1518-N6/adenine1519-N6)-dimethyltransferase
MIRKKRSLGQVFLKDKKYIEKILNCLEVEGKTVLEIGPGNGTISSLLGKKAKKLYCVEIDSRFYNFLKEKFSQSPNIEIIHTDIFKFDLAKLGKRLVIFGNAPYYISSQLIEYFVSYRNYIDQAYLTFQKEFVQKLLAKKSNGQYTFLSCYIQYYARVKKLFDIGAGAFDPHPKVDSTFICLDFYKRPPHMAKSEEVLFKTIRSAFSSRRKKIINSLPIPSDKVDFLSKIKIDPNLRAQDLSLKDYILIANSLYRR